MGLCFVVWGDIEDNCVGFVFQDFVVNEEWLVNCGVDVD